jgi:hypothetical protein
MLELINGIGLNTDYLARKIDIVSPALIEA